ncbi:unnamed protein product [Auanema sp. JU1783]|nr:unnamed protein product [Auanema sp. JU1783]
MEVCGHEIEDDRLPNGKLHLTLVLPELNTVTEPVFNIYITFETNLPRIPLMGFFPQSISSCDVKDEEFLRAFVNDFILFKRDFLDKIERVERNDILRIQFRRKLHDQFGVRFFYHSVSQNNYLSDFYIFGLCSARTLVILEPRANFQVLNEQAYLASLSSPMKAKIITFECTICFEHFFPHEMVALPCGHIFCRGEASKLSNCAICTKPKEPQFPLKVRDGACPIDKCFNSKDLYILLPCCCVIAHGMDSIRIQQCPFSTCKRKVEKTQKLFFHLKP